MRIPLALLGIASTSTCLAQESPAPRARPAISPQLEYAYEKKRPTSTPRDSQASDADLGIYELKPFTVKGRDTYVIFDHEFIDPKRVPFTWKQGGTFHRYENERSTTELMFQYDPRNNAVKLLNISF